MLVSLLATTLLFSPSAPHLQGGFETGPFGALEARGNSETFLAMLEMSGIRAELEGSERAFTLLAPQDAAFRGVTPETVARLFEPSSRATLRSILLAHVVSGSVDAVTLLGLDGAEARSGVPLSATIAAGQLVINGAAVVAQDLPCTGGAAHELASVILPDPSVLEPTAERRVAMRAVALASVEGLTDEGRRAVYQMALASLAELPAASAAVLRARADSAATLGELESTIYGVLGAEAPSMTSTDSGPEGGPADDTSTLLVAFDSSDTDPSWYTLNDDVMGGISQSKFEQLDGDGGAGLFTGALSMENNGGFASIRSSRDGYDLSEYTGIRLRVRTDGREYKIGVSAGDSRGRSGTWRSASTTPRGEWTTVDLPFEDMVLNIRGRRYPDVGPPKRDAIQSFSITIGDKDETPFRFEIASIGAYR